MNSKQRIKQIKESINRSMDYFIEEILKSCDSDIEKQFILRILQIAYHDISNTVPHFYRKRDSTWLVNKIEPIIDEKWELDEKKYEKWAKSKPDYQGYYPWLHKTVGFRIRDEHSISDEHTIYEFLPQYNTTTTPKLHDNYEKKYKLDFAIFSKHYLYNNKLGEYEMQQETKIAMECDGFEFHSNKFDHNYDIERANHLSLDGWIMFRKTGSQIYAIDTYTKGLKLFNEIRYLTKPRFKIFENE